MKRFYSQHGEDVLLEEIFKNQKSGFFVEIGCIDGRRFSNTLSLEKKGWCGICVEAHSDYIPLLKKNRPNSKVIHAAVSETDKDEVIFYANSRGSLSTLDKNQEERFRREYRDFFTGFKEQKVVQKTLNTLFKENKVKNIDLLSVDVEGGEQNVLLGINFDQFKPRVMVIECENHQEERQLDKILLKPGYIKSVRVANNIFYTIDPMIHELVINQLSTATLTHTQHPLDDTGDQVKPVEINTKYNKKTTFKNFFLGNKEYRVHKNFKKDNKVSLLTPKNSTSLSRKGSKNWRVFISSVFRETENSKMSGFLIELEWPSGIIKKKISIPATTATKEFWSARGGNRGGRGLYYFDNEIYLATAISIRKYDMNLNLISEFTHPKLAGIHEISVDATGIWITSTLHDLLIKLNHKGELIKEWYGSEDKKLQKIFNYTSRSLVLDMNFKGKYAQEYDNYARDERLHLNSVQVVNNQVYSFANRIGAMIRVFPQPTSVEIHDRKLISAHNALILPDNKLIINNTENQSIAIFDLLNKNIKREISTKIFNTKSTGQFTNAGWQRGLANIDNDNYLVGSSPLSVFEVDINNGKIGKIVQLSQDIRHCVHGLLVLQK
jgi:FkbM family methyltransferase